MSGGVSGVRLIGFKSPPLDSKKGAASSKPPMLHALGRRGIAEVESARSTVA